MIDFRSDTVTRPTAAMREAMAAAPVGDDVYGDDPTVNRLQSFIAQQLGFEAALFMPSGTQANLVALLSHCQRGDEVICGQQQHIFRWEAGGMAVLGSIVPQPIEQQPDGSLDLAAVEAAIKPDDPHHPRTRLLAAENTIGGKLLPPDYLRGLRALADRHGLATHLDGARLFNAAAETVHRCHPVGRNDTHGDARLAATDIWSAARDLCAHFDTVSVCLSKGLGAPVGSVLLGSADLIRRALRHRKMLGGGLRQVGVLAAAGLHALEHHVERLADDHLQAKRLADGFAALAARHGGLSVQGTATNMVFIRIDEAIAARFAAHLAHAGIACVTRYGSDSAAAQRWVTHLDVGPSDVDFALETVDGFFSGYNGR